MDWNQYHDRVYGCWLGKNIGGTIGMPFEGNKDFHAVLPEPPSRVLPNDDLDLQLVWLDVLKHKGIKITSDDLAEAWLKNVIYPWDEYGVAIANLKAGLSPPATGYYNNWFHSGMGAAIRSELWACIFPAMPETAGWYAYQDACVDHRGEGVYGEIFFAALESAAFAADGLDSAIDAGLAFLPEGSAVFKVVELARGLYSRGKSLRECRDEILREFGHYNFTDCVQNIGFTVAGLLYGGGDFLKTIASAVNCGYDTDCTGATAGAVVGIMLGRDRIIAKGCKAGEEIIPGWGIKGIEPPPTLEELTGQAVTLGNLAAGETKLPSISRPFALPPVGEFEKPLSIPFDISASFTPEEAAGVEKEMLNGGDSGFKKAVFDSSHFDLGEYFGKSPSVIFLRTTIKLNEKKKIRFFPASTGSVKMWLNGNPVLENPGGMLFLPSPHRNENSMAEAELDEGEHDILLKVGRDGGENFQFAWIPADGENHLLVDVEYVVGADEKAEAFA